MDVMGGTVLSLTAIILHLEHTDRQTDCQTDRDTDIQTDRQTDRQTDTDRTSADKVLVMGGAVLSLTAIILHLEHTERQTDCQTDRDTDIQTDRQTHRHTDRQTDTDETSADKVLVMCGA